MTKATGHPNRSQAGAGAEGAVSDAAARRVIPIGIDVAKDKLDVQLLRSLDRNAKTSYKQFDNSPAGFAKLVRWAEQTLSQLDCPPGYHLTPHYCMESTGPYSQALAQFLAQNSHQNGHLVSIVNPYLVRHYGEGCGMLNKNDKADARVIAHYCRAETPEPWCLSRPEARILLALVRRLRGVQQHLQQETNRLEDPGLVKPVITSIKKSIRFLEKESASLEEEIRRHINSDEGPNGLKKNRELLMSIPGIGETLATSILAELPDVTTFKSADSVAAYAGLSPQEHKSGKSVDKPTRLSGKGNARLRRALFMPALCACRYNPLLANLYKRLIERGLSRKAAVCAVMRKLLMFAYGVLKNREPFNLEWVALQAAKRNPNNINNSVAAA
jgi:transposase